MQVGQHCREGLGGVVIGGRGILQDGNSVCGQVRGSSRLWVSDPQGAGSGLDPWREMTVAVGHQEQGGRGPTACFSQQVLVRQLHPALGTTKSCLRPRPGPVEHKMG